MSIDISTLIAYMFCMWAVDQITFEIDAETDGSIAVVDVSTPAGLIKICAELHVSGRTLQVTGLHVQSELGPNAIGLNALRVIAAAAMERMDFDAIEIEGAPRTTGANPGRRSKPLRFTRARRVTPGK